MAREGAAFASRWCGLRPSDAFSSAIVVVGRQRRICSCAGGRRGAQEMIFALKGRAESLPAFDAGAGCTGSMPVYGIVVASGALHAPKHVLPLIEAVLGDWELPADWPEEVPLIVQAGVDGDAAGCHCRSSQIEQELCGRYSALQPLMGIRSKYRLGRRWRV